MADDSPRNISVHSLRNCKTIHLIRHAEGYHNAAGEADRAAYMSHDYFDARITPLGWKQVAHLRRHLEDIELIRKVDLVVTSPTMRTMQTAVGAFGGIQCVDGNQSFPSFPENDDGTMSHAIPNSFSPPLLATELCRELLGVYPCLKRQSITVYRKMFPGIDFSEIEDDDDILWKPDVLETDLDLIERSKRFLEWLSKRREKEIAVVSHGAFLAHMLSIIGEGCSETIQKQLRKGFNNCELRSIVLVNHRELGESIPEDYQGEIPPGTDISCDALDAADNT